MLYVEEPLPADGPAEMEVTRDRTGVLIGVPRVPPDLPPSEHGACLQRLLADAIRTHIEGDYVLWFYTPMALPFTHHLNAAAVVYDCMDELSAFAGAPPALQRYERELFAIADVVFTGGATLFEAKRAHHPNVHAFPSSVDVEHFAQARQLRNDPPDQTGIPRPRLGFFGVIDERMDYHLLAGVAAARPDWHLVLVGPTAKIDPAHLPRARNLHYLGPKSYLELPEYIAGWDLAMLPFARNEATRYISPTKTPEYLAAGKAVVSTSIRDVVRPYGQQGLARIADTVDEFVAAVAAALSEEPVGRLRAADAFLTHLSWDGTWLRMRQLVEQAIANRGQRDSNARTAS